MCLAVVQDLHELNNKLKSSMISSNFTNDALMDALTGIETEVFDLHSDLCKTLEPPKKRQILGQLRQGLPLQLIPS